MEDKKAIISDFEKGMLNKLKATDFYTPSYIFALNEKITELKNKSFLKQAAPCFFSPLVAFLYAEEVKAKRIEKSFSAYADTAMKVHNDSVNNIQTTGMGFGIITNDVASAVAYDVLNKKEHEKQYVAQKKGIDDALVSNLSVAERNKKAKEDEYLVAFKREFKIKLKEVMDNLTSLVDVIEFHEKHQEYFSEKDLYADSLEIQGLNVYDVLTDIDAMCCGAMDKETRHKHGGGVTGNVYARETIKIFEQKGYVKIINEVKQSSMDKTRISVSSQPYLFVSTLKFERDSLMRVFSNQNPEEYAKLKKKKKELTVHLKELKKQLDDFETDKKERREVLKQSLNRKLVEEKQAEDLGNELNGYRVELSKCGIFQGKKKKELQAIISDLTAKQAELISLAETKKAERESSVEEKIKLIKSEGTELKDEIKRISKEIDELWSF